MTLDSKKPRLEAVAVIDTTTKNAPGLRARQKALDELQGVVESLNVSLQVISFDKLDFGETTVLETFYNADVAIVDLSIRIQQSALTYHLGVRESMNQTYNIIIHCIMDTTREQGFITPLKLTFAHYRILLYSDEDESEELRAWDPSSGLPSYSSLPLTTSAVAASSMAYPMSFKIKIKKLLKDVQVDATGSMGVEQIALEDFNWQKSSRKGEVSLRPARHQTDFGGR